MPNRIIKESIHTSESVAAMSDFQFRLWVSLITYVDDYGRGDARPAIIKGACFPLKERLTLKEIENALTGLADIGCVGLYEVDGKPYLYFPKWEQHQRVRQKISKFPAPEDGCELRPSAASGGELPQSAASGGLNPESRIQNPIQNPDTNARARASDGDKFEKFWQAYPKKVGKIAAQKAFDKVSAPIETLLQAIEQQKRGELWLRDNGRYIPNPATWLNQGRWEDQVQLRPGEHRVENPAPGYNATDMIKQYTERMRSKGGAANGA